MGKRKNVPLGLAIARSQYSYFIGDAVRSKRAFFQLKKNLDFPDLCVAADYIDKNVPKNFKEPLFGNPLPKSYFDIGRCDFSYTSENIISEINWALLAIRKYSFQINLFLIYKQEYDNSLLLGDFSEAERYIDKIEKEICFSLWTLENRFLIKEMSSNSSENKELLSWFNNINESKYYTKSLAHYLSVRAETSLSVNRFNADLDIALGKLEGDKKQTHAEYYLFKLSFLNHLKFSCFTEIISYDFPQSIIDRYLTFRKALVSLLTVTNSIIEKDQGEINIKNYILNRINYLTRKINDPILFKLKLFAGERMFPAFEVTEGQEQLKVIDKYTAGLYAEVEEELAILLLKTPCQFDLYNLYVKSLVFQRKEFVSVGHPKSLQNQILHQMFLIVSARVNPSEPSTTLLRIANNITSCTLSFGIIDFVIYQTKGQDEIKLFAKLSYSAANPITSEIFSDVDMRIKYLQFLDEKFPGSITIDFLLKKNSDVENILEFESRLPEVQYKTEMAKAFQHKRQFVEAVRIWEALIISHSTIMPIFETSIRNLFICYEELRRYDDCIKLYVNSFFINAYITGKIEVQSILKKINDNRFKIVSPSIELPIFYTIVNADENEIHIAFERFNLLCGICKPSEFINGFDSYAPEKMLFYLKYTCGAEILKHSIHINGSKERLEERLTICQFLREKDTEDKAFYDDEIKYISNILVIQKGLMELDESKIYVNEQGIIGNELREFDAIYQRFKTIGKIAEKSDLWMLDKRGRLTTVNYLEDKSEATDIQYSENPVYDIYKELFDSIKDKFLYSKFGIVAYLSTRIRHGVLLGEIRPVFEMHKLITLREGDSSNYRRNYYWDNIYSDELNLTQAKIQNFLKEFSYCVDGLIFDLIKKYLQVFDPILNPDGWFNYDFNDDELFWFSFKALKSRDFAHFAQEVFEILWDKTDSNLNLIRNKIQNEISMKFNELFDKLERDVVDLLGPYKHQPLVNSIKSCSTDTLNVITRISSWFKRSGTSASDFQLDNLIDIVMEYTNKTNSNKKIHLLREVNYSEKIRGEYLTHFADLFRIFTENIIKHADEKIAVIAAKIVVNSNNNNELVIQISNDISNKDSLHALKNVWKNMTIDISKLSSEGKSGYHKAFKIIKSDLKNENNKLATQISEDEEQFIVKMYISLKELIA